MYKFYAAVQENRAISCVSGEDMLSLFIEYAAVKWRGQVMMKWSEKL